MKNKILGILMVGTPLGIFLSFLYGALAYKYGIQALTVISGIFLGLVIIIALVFCIVAGIEKLSRW